VRETNGFGVAITDDAILATGRLLARHGLLVEPSSAASVAGALQSLRDRPELREQTVVCVITSSGLKWLDDYEDATPLAGGVRVETVAAARAAVEEHARESVA
jgi:threonine synthase